MDVISSGYLFDSASYQTNIILGYFLGNWDKIYFYKKFEGDAWYNEKASTF